MPSEQYEKGWGVTTWAGEAADIIAKQDMPIGPCSYVACQGYEWNTGAIYITLHYITLPYY